MMSSFPCPNIVPLKGFVMSESIGLRLVVDLGTDICISVLYEAKINFLILRFLAYGCYHSGVKRAWYFSNFGGGSCCRLRLPFWIFLPFLCTWRVTVMSRCRSMIVADHDALTHHCLGFCWPNRLTFVVRVETADTGVTNQSWIRKIFTLWSPAAGPGDLLSTTEGGWWLTSVGFPSCFSAWQCCSSDSPPPKGQGKK